MYITLHSIIILSDLFSKNNEVVELRLRERESCSRGMNWHHILVMVAINQTLDPIVQSKNRVFSSKDELLPSSLMWRMSDFSWQTWASITVYIHKIRKQKLWSISNVDVAWIFMRAGPQTRWWEHNFIFTQGMQWGDFYCCVKQTFYMVYCSFEEYQGM